MVVFPPRSNCSPHAAVLRVLRGLHARRREAAAAAEGGIAHRAERASSAVSEVEF